MPSKLILVNIYQTKLYHKMTQLTLLLYMAILYPNKCWATSNLTLYVN